MAKDGRVVSKAERDIAAYLGDRVQYKINVYDGLSRRYRGVYWTMATIAAVGAVLVPAMVNFEPDKRVTTMVSLIVAAVIALEKVFRPREHWRNYSLIAALLREEEMMFSTRSGPYSASRLAVRGRDGVVRTIDPFERLVERVEDAIHREREETILMRTTRDPSADEGSAPNHKGEQKGKLGDVIA